MDAAAKADMIERKGETVTLVRPIGGQSALTYSADCRAMVRRYGIQELTGAIVQGDRELRVSPIGLRARKWPEPIQVNDRVLIDGKQAVVRGVDDAKVQDDVAFYILQVRG